MKKLFTAIRQGKLNEVTRILDNNPDLISCLAVAPPKKDHGQSPLMVAIKSDNPAVAHLVSCGGPVFYGGGKLCVPGNEGSVKGIFSAAAPPVGHGYGPQSKGDI